MSTIWSNDIYSGKLGNAHWLRRRSEECNICALERKRRCCVIDSSDLSPTLEDDKRFAAAPYIHAFNEPKYHASQVRALHYGRETNRVVIWRFAEDRPLSKNIVLLKDCSLDDRRKQWLGYHDMKTGGIMGMQPLVRDMPLRITQTDHKRKDKRMFKNSRCRLFGWELHPAAFVAYALGTALPPCQRALRHRYFSRTGSIERGRLTVFKRANRTVTDHA